MDDNDLLTRVCETNAAYLALGNESWYSHGARFIRNRSTPRRHDANCVTQVRAQEPDEVEALLQELDDAFEGLAHRNVGLDALTPQAFTARLALEEGYKPGQGLVHVLEGELNASPKPVEIREVLSDDDWAAYMEMDKMWWLESGTGPDALGPYDAAMHEEFMLNTRLKSPAVRRWFACVDEVPRAFFASWPGENGVGMVEDLFCHLEYRHRGLATALIAHCVADARERGAGPVIINSGIDDTPKRMYAAMGFRPYYVMRNCSKKLS